MFPQFKKLIKVTFPGSLLEIKTMYAHCRQFLKYRKKKLCLHLATTSSLHALHFFLVLSLVYSPNMSMAWVSDAFPDCAPSTGLLALASGHDPHTGLRLSSCVCSRPSPPSETMMSVFVQKSSVNISLEINLRSKITESRRRTLLSCLRTRWALKNRGGGSLSPTAILTVQSLWGILA